VTRIALHLAALLVIGVFLAGCGKDTVPLPGAYVPSISDPNRFLMFPNSQPSLGVGDYNVGVYDYTLPSNPTNYTLTITYDDGTTKVVQGNWTTSGQYNLVPLEMKSPGGIQLALDSGGANAFVGIYNASILR
jgi:hypothetical protein